jgi:hypothetical protein
VTVNRSLYRVIAKEIIRWNEVLRGVYAFQAIAV